MEPCTDHRLRLATHLYGQSLGIMSNKNCLPDTHSKSVHLASCDLLRNVINGEIEVVVPKPEPEELDMGIAGSVAADILLDLATDDVDPTHYEIQADNGDHTPGMKRFIVEMYWNPDLETP